MSKTEKASFKRIGVNVSDEKLAEIDNYRWPNHLTMAEFLAEAIDAHLAANKVVSDPVSK